MIAYFNPQDRLQWINREFEQALGWSLEELKQQELEQQHFLAALYPDLAYRQQAHTFIQEARTRWADFRPQTRDGRILDITAAVIKLSDSSKVGIAQDITTRKAYEAQLERQANYDSLTGLANRNLLQERLQHSLAHARRGQRQVAVLFLDLDRLKRINDSLGYDAGDSLLQAMAGRLSAGLREGDTVARVGGDEFAIVLEDLLPSGDLQALITHKLRTALSLPFQVAGQDIFMTTSVGISLFPQDSETPQQLLKQAYFALQQAKIRGRNCLQFYSEQMENLPNASFLTLENRLRTALEQKQLELYYQPQVDPSTGQVLGAEALVRWRDPQRGLISPLEFIPVAEESGLIIPLGQWVLETACAQAQAWQAAGLPPVMLAVNLSAQQFLQGDLVAQVTQALRQSQLAAHCLEVEITESLLMEDVSRAVALLSTLKALGVAVAIDDFGTGYSSLNYLRRFPLDILKVDRSFIQEILTDSADAAIAQAVIGLAHSLQLKVVAEGVETEAQAAFLRTTGCYALQGYYFSPPLPAKAFACLLQAQKT